MFVWLREQGFESSVNKEFQKENEVFIQVKKLNIIHSSKSTFFVFFYEEKHYFVHSFLSLNYHISMFKIHIMEQCALKNVNNFGIPIFPFN